MHEGAEGEVAEDRAEREQPRVVGHGERAEEPEVADGSQQQARPVVGPPPERDQAAQGERQPDRHGEADRRGLALLVVAGENEPGRRRRERERQRGTGDERAASHASNAETAFPERSAFAMKPRAPLSWIRQP